MKQRLTIHNKDATETSNDGFKFTMQNKIIMSSSFKINKIIIGNNFHQINSSNNTLKINSTVITITAGNYTDSELLTAIQTQLTAIAATYSITLGPNTQLITIAESTPTNFALNLASSTLNKVLGFGSTNLTGAATYTATNYFNNSWPFITMHSKILTYDMNHNMMSDLRSDILEVIPLNVSKGDYVCYEPEDSVEYPLKIEGSVLQFDFYFRDPYNNAINDINKCLFMIELIFN
jgi:hypothetical protein